MAEPTYDPYAYSDIGKRALGGEYINSMNFFWFDPVTGEEGQTTEGWSRVPDSVKPYTYLEPGSRNEARNTFYESGAAFGGAGGLSGGMGGGGLLSGQAYAQQIAGGMPFEQVVAPGMSFSPDQPMGYLAEGATPFQPRPVVGQPVSEQRFFPSASNPEVGMTGANLGLPMGSGTPMPAGVIVDESSIGQLPAPSVMGSPLPLDIDIDELLKNIDVEKAIENLPTPESMTAPIAETPMSTIDTHNPNYMGFEDERLIGRQNEAAVSPPPSIPFRLPQIIPEAKPVMPSIPIMPPVMEQPMVNIPALQNQAIGIGSIPNIGSIQIPQFNMEEVNANLLAAGITPQMPTPSPVMQQPMVNLGMSPTNPVLNIDNIVSPIRQGSLRELLGRL